MQIHNIKRKTKNKKSRSVGRGGKRGKTSGRGTKGQKARAGAKLRPEIRDFIKRLPKLRGRGIAGLKSIQSKPVPVNLEVIEKLFSKNEEVTPTSLVRKGIVKMSRGANPRIKILSQGEITKPIIVSGCLFSEGAKEKIEKAGGSII